MHSKSAYIIFVQEPSCIDYKVMETSLAFRLCDCLKILRNQLNHDSQSIPMKAQTSLSCYSSIIKWSFCWTLGSIRSHFIYAFNAELASSVKFKNGLYFSSILKWWMSFKCWLSLWARALSINNVNSSSLIKVGISLRNSLNWYFKF